jgi:hypothetical protein
MNEKIDLFTLSVYKTFLQNIDNDKLLKEIEKFDTTPNVKDPSPAHTFYEDKLYPFGQPESMKLIDEITNSVNYFTNSDMIMDSIWSITLEKGQSVLSHTHKVNTQLYPEEYYSVSYYVSAPKDSADLIFVTTHCNTIERATSVKTETGMLLIFNSYIPHMTNRQYSEEKRVVVSANFSPKTPNTNPSADWSEYKVPNR